jgi:hypothetical protein
MKPTLQILRSALFLSSITFGFIGCSSDENSNSQAKPETEVFQGYKASMEKVEGVEETLLQADQSRRDALERQE